MTGRNIGFVRRHMNVLVSLWKRRQNERVYRRWRNQVPPGRETKRT